ARRRGVEAPHFGTVRDFERHDRALDAPVAASLAGEHEVIPDHWRDTDAFSDGPVGNLALPQYLAGLGIQRVDRAILRTADHASLRERHAFVGRVHLGSAGNVLMRPAFAAGFRVDRVRAKMRGGIEHAVVDDGSGLEGAELAELGHAYGTQARRGARIELLEL